MVSNGILRNFCSIIKNYPLLVVITSQLARRITDITTEVGIFLSM